MELHEFFGLKNKTGKGLRTIIFRGSKDVVSNFLRPKKLPGDTSTEIFEYDLKTDNGLDDYQQDEPATDGDDYQQDEPATDGDDYQQEEAVTASYIFELPIRPELIGISSVLIDNEEPYTLDGGPIHMPQNEEVELRERRGARWI